MAGRRKKSPAAEEQKPRRKIVIPPPYYPTNPFEVCAACGGELVRAQTPSGWAHVTIEARESCDDPHAKPDPEKP